MIYANVPTPVEPSGSQLELSDRLNSIVKMINIATDDVANTTGNVMGATPAFDPYAEPVCHLEAIKVIEDKLSILCELTRVLYNALR